jgi:hypothetical protein
MTLAVEKVRKSTIAMPTLMRTTALVPMLAALALRTAFPLLGDHALSLDPFHVHVVIGGTPEQRAKALLTHHHHRFMSAGCHREETDAWPASGHGATVLSVSASTAVGASVLSTAGLGIAGPAIPWALTCSPGSRLLPVSQPTPRRLSPAPLEPPPRAS